MRKVFLVLTLIVLGCLTLIGCSKDEILNHYNNVVQSVGTVELTKDSFLKGTRKYGIDHYTGIYSANYKNFSKTEYLFGGTSIKRDSGKNISVSCTLKISSGSAKVFWISGSNKPIVLIETDGTYSDTITLPDGGNYIGIECDNFTGSINISIK